MNQRERDALDDWWRSLTDERRAELFEEVFGGAEKTGASQPQELPEGAQQQFEQAFRRWKQKVSGLSESDIESELEKDEKGEYRDTFVGWLFTVFQLRSFSAVATEASSHSGDYPAWRPIETAPKDGSEILVYSPIYRGRIATAKWDDDQFAKRPRPYWGMSLPGSSETADSRANQPTHWMPLPPAPGTTAPSSSEGEVKGQADQVDAPLAESGDSVADRIFDQCFRKKKGSWKLDLSAAGEIIEAYAKQKADKAVAEAVKPYAEAIVRSWWTAVIDFKYPHCRHCRRTNRVPEDNNHDPDCIVPKATAALNTYGGEE